MKEAYNKAIKEYKENPIIGHEEIEPKKITTKEHIKELQDLLVQTCIDYINEKGLTDIYSVYFSADSLAESAIWESWQPCTDSFISVKGVQKIIYRREDGSEIEGSQLYNIGESM